MIITAVDSRVYPMFAFLFAGSSRCTSARSTAEPTHARSGGCSVDAHLWMIVIGALHAGPLWMGDIVGAYGLVGPDLHRGLPEPAEQGSAVPRWSVCRRDLSWVFASSGR